MSQDNLFKIRRSTTSSGLRLLVLPMGGTSTVALVILIGTGSRYEPTTESGISHFLEHLFFKGSKKRPTTRLIAGALDQVGGEFNAFTSKEMTGFYAKAGSQYVGLLLDVLGDMVLYPLLKPRDIERERGVIAEEINMYEDTPLESIGDFWEQLLFGQHALGRRVIGTKKNIAALSKGAFKRYIKRQYTTGNVVVCLAGNIGAPEGIALLKKQFRAFPKGRVTQPLPFRNRWGKARIAFKEKPTDQAHVIVGGTGVSFTHKDRCAADLLGTILGGNMSSRLFLEVRERHGLAYYIRTSAEHFTDVGYVATQAGVDPGKLLDTLGLILREYQKVREKGVSRAELEKAKENVKGRLLLKLESSSAVAQFVGGQEVLTGRILTVDDVFKRVEAVTQQDVHRVARKHLAPRQLRIAAIAPQQQGGDLERLLQTSR